MKPLYMKLIGGPETMRTGPVHEPDLDHDNPPAMFMLYEDRGYTIPILSFAFFMMGHEMIDGEQCYIYQYAGRCDNLLTKRSESQLIGEN